MRLIDAHAHMDNKAFNRDLDRCIKRAKEQRVVGVINGSSDGPTAEKALRIARKYPNMWSTAGVHPHKAKDHLEDPLKWIRTLAKDPKVVAIGEMGLDYHYDHSPRDVQREVFERLIHLAVELQMPAVIHSREADADTFVMLEKFPAGHKVLLHCFSGDELLLEEAMDYGYYISLGGVVTFQNAEKTREVARRVPLDRLLLETDAPFLTPHPYRGQRNEPANIPLIAEEIAVLRGEDVETIAAETTAATEDFYGIKIDG